MTGARLALFFSRGAALLCFAVRLAGGTEKTLGCAGRRNIASVQRAACPEGADTDSSEEMVRRRSALEEQRPAWDTRKPNMAMPSLRHAAFALLSAATARALTSAIAPGAPQLGTTPNYNAVPDLTVLWNATFDGCDFMESYPW